MLKKPLCNMQWKKINNYWNVLFVWRANLGRIPTSYELSKRGIHFGDTKSEYCLQEANEVIHVLIKCSFAWVIWQWILKWCNISIPHLKTVGDVINYVMKWGNSPKKGNALITILYGTLWWIWNAICDKTFKKTCMSSTLVVEKIMSSVFTWIKHRSE